MSDSKPTTPQADALAKQLKASLSKRRFQPWKVVITALVLSALLLAMLAWWMYPRARALPLQIVALDAVCTPDDTPMARAQLLAPPEETQKRTLSGQTIVFHEQRLLLKPGEKAREVVVKSDERGQAATEWPMPKAPMGDFLVNYIDADKRNLQSDRGHIFIWPKDAPLLIVDADQTLGADEVDAKASATLAQASKKGWRIVYLLLAAAEAHEFRTRRGWIIRNQARLPIGPVLGRGEWPGEESPEPARRETLKSLKNRFNGPMSAVVKDADAARASQEAGLQTILLGAGPAPAQVILAATWADVAERLK